MAVGEEAVQQAGRGGGGRRHATAAEQQQEEEYEAVAQWSGMSKIYSAMRRPQHENHAAGGSANNLNLFKSVQRTLPLVQHIRVL